MNEDSHPNNPKSPGKPAPQNTRRNAKGKIENGFKSIFDALYPPQQQQL